MSIEIIANYLPKILPLPSICRKCLLNRGQISVIDHLNPSPLTAVSSIYQFPLDYCPDRTSNNWRIVIRELDVLNLLCKSRDFNLQSQRSKNGHRVVRLSQYWRLCHKTELTLHKRRRNIQIMFRTNSSHWTTFDHKTGC